MVVMMSIGVIRSLLEQLDDLLDVVAHVVVHVAAQDFAEVVDVRERADEVLEFVAVELRDLVLDLVNEFVTRLRSPWLLTCFGELERVGDGAGDKRECRVRRDDVMPLMISIVELSRMPLVVPGVKSGITGSTDRNAAAMHASRDGVCGGGGDRVGVCGSGCDCGSGFDSSSGSGCDCGSGSDSSSGSGCDCGSGSGSGSGSSSSSSCGGIASSSSSCGGAGASSSLGEARSGAGC